MKFHTIILLLCLCFILLLQHSSADHGKGKKVKCKEHIDAALKQYWDHEKHYNPHSDATEELKDGDNDDDDTNEDDDDDDDDSNDHDSGDDDDNSDDDDDTNEHDDDDKDDNTKEHDSDEDDDDDDDDTKESKSVEISAKVSKSTVKHSKEDDDDNDSHDDDDSKEHLTKNKNSKDDDDDDDDDDDTDEDDDDDDDNSVEIKINKKTVSKEKESKSKSSKTSDKKINKRQTYDDDDDDDTEEDDDDDDDDDDSDEHKVTKSKSNKGQKSKSKSIKKKSSNIKKNKKRKHAEDDDDSDEDDEEMRSRTNIEKILRLDQIGKPEDKQEQRLVDMIFREIKRIYDNAIRPLEQLFKYNSISNRRITDTEIFATPLVMFMGAKASGKTTLINYLLGLQKTEWALPAGQPTSPLHFTIISHGKEFEKQTPLEFSSDVTFNTLQQFGDRFIEQKVHSYKMPLNILERMTIVDCPSFIENPLKPSETALSGDSQVYQWFFDRSDVIYITLDVNQLQVSTQMQTILEQLRGRDVRFILNKADTVKHSELILLIGQLFWMLSPLMPADRPPQVYALTTAPMSEFDLFLDGQEQLWLTDLSEQVQGALRIESRIATVRRHAVRVRNHAKLVDCYLGAYNRAKGLFTFGSSARQLAAHVAHNPHEYAVFQAAARNTESNLKYAPAAGRLSANMRLDYQAGSVTNSTSGRHELADANAYREFFKLHPLGDFSPISATCSLFRGCPLDKLDVAIAFQLPDLLAKYRSQTKLH